MGSGPCLVCGADPCCCAPELHECHFHGVLILSGRFTNAHLGFKKSLPSILLHKQLLIRIHLIITAIEFVFNERGFGGFDNDSPTTDG